MPSETKELRGDAPADLVRALDALALSKDMTRHAYVIDVLEAHVRKELHRVTLINAMMRGNPLLADNNRSDAGSAFAYDTRSVRPT